MAPAMKQSAADRELQAIASILNSLESLEGESIQRVLDYVFSRLSLPATGHVKSFTAASIAQPASPVDTAHIVRQPSIRDLKEEKQPESSNQMAALVAYYLSEVLTGEERKETVNTADLEKYFKQAGFRLPKTLTQTLQNATAAGYFDAVGDGRFKLNPVGYNLVVHGLPRPHAPSGRARKPRKPSKPSKRR